MKNQNQRLGLHMCHRLVFSVFLLFGAGVHAQTAIEAVTGSIQGGTEVVRIDLTKELTAVPTGFAIQ